MSDILVSILLHFYFHSPSQSIYGKNMKNNFRGRWVELFPLAVLNGEFQLQSCVRWMRIYLEVILVYGKFSYRFVSRAYGSVINRLIEHKLTLILLVFIEWNFETTVFLFIFFIFYFLLLRRRYTSRHVDNTRRGRLWRHIRYLCPGICGERLQYETSLSQFRVVSRNSQ